RSTSRRRRLPGSLRTRRPRGRSRTSLSRVHPGDGRGARTLHNLVAHRHALGELADVGDDADHAAVVAERLEGGGDGVQAVGVEGAEALVEEDGVELRGAASGKSADVVSESEREG